MENETAAKDSLIKELNDETMRLMIPALIYIAILMVLGFIGNLMVCFFYGFKTRMTTNTIFICVLAVYDLFVCAIAMPTEIADIVFYYTFENDVACKILRFVNYCTSLGSGLTLIAIAIDRHRRICHKTLSQMTIHNIKFCCIIILVIAIFLSWPAVLIFGSIKISIPNDYGVELDGFDCTSTKEDDYRPYVWAFNIVHFATFIISTVVLITLYSIIGKVIYRHNKRMSHHSPPKPATPSSASTSVEETSFDTNIKPTPVINGTPSKRPRSSKNKDDENRKLTLVMVTITVLFVLSFLPYLVLTIWRITEGTHETEFLSDAGLVAFKIGTRSFLINSAGNPWIYGIFNSSFRNYFFGRISTIICRFVSFFKCQPTGSG